MSKGILIAQSASISELLDMLHKAVATSYEAKQPTNRELLAIVNGDVEAEKEEQIAAWQGLINSGIVWRLKGHYPSVAKRLINDGLCHEAE